MRNLPCPRAARSAHADRRRRNVATWPWAALFLLAWAQPGCFGRPPEAVPPVRCAGPLDPVSRIEGMPGAEHFQESDVEGVFVLQDEATHTLRTTDISLADTPFRPQSTFKIPNALIGLELGVIEGGAGANAKPQTWKWDGTPQRLKDWEQDLDLAGALRVSCVPCFQDVARRVGRPRMQQYLHNFRYGNETIEGASEGDEGHAPVAIDRFWLDGPLRITPREQVDFVHRMVSYELPAKRENVDLLWSLLEIEHGVAGAARPEFGGGNEQHVAFTYRGKTGLGSQEGRAIGWLVGYIDRTPLPSASDGGASHRWIYATLLRGREGRPVDAEVARITPLRKMLTRKLLEQEGILPPASK